MNKWEIFGLSMATAVTLSLGFETAARKHCAADASHSGICAPNADTGRTIVLGSAGAGIAVATLLYSASGRGKIR